jgi:hypothetical protein
MGYREIALKYYGNDTSLIFEALANTIGNTNSEWIDTSGYLTNATQLILLSRPVLTNDRFGVGRKGYVFDGVNDYMIIPDSDRFSFTNGESDQAFSIEISFKFNTVANAWLINKRTSSTNLEWQLAYYNNSWIFYLYDSNFQNYIGCLYTITPLVGVNYILKATYNGSGTANGLKIYQDGILLNTTNGSTGLYYSMKNTTSIINIGRFGQGGSNLNGDIEYVKIWKGVI